MVDLRGNPFYLNDEQVAWVEKTLTGLTLEEKVGQLFCEVVWDGRENELDDVTRHMQPGAVMFRFIDKEDVREFADVLQKRSRVPMLMAMNYEHGANDLLNGGTVFGSQMVVAATDDPQAAYDKGWVTGRESAAVGTHWAFTPMVDLNMNPFSEVTNRRTFGSNPETVSKMGVAFMKGAHDQGMAITAKHFPGDGMDWRDQHHSISVNTCSVEEWDATYGKIYQNMIAGGLDAIMAGHIHLPAYQQYYQPDLKPCDMPPATLSYDLLTRLLRGKLGFNGLILTDDTHMAGFTTYLPRSRAVPASIAAGCDMFLFVIDQEEDFGYMMEGVRDGTITPERLDEAVTRILAMKAHMNLHTRQASGTLTPPAEGLSVIGCKEHWDKVHRIEEQAITLVKDREQLLPITPEKYRRLLVANIEAEGRTRFAAEPQFPLFVELLKKEGFEVTVLDVDDMPRIGHRGATMKEISQKYDMLIYYVGSKNAAKLRWKAIVCGDVPSYVRELPNVFISLANPYAIMDASSIGTVVNTYNETEHIVRALVDRLMGKAPFTGVSPVDPFMGWFDKDF